MVNESMIKEEKLYTGLVKIAKTVSLKISGVGKTGQICAKENKIGLLSYIIYKNKLKMN